LKQIKEHLTGKVQQSSLNEDEPLQVIKEINYVSN